MIDSASSRATAAVILRFALVFALMVAPWPGAKNAIRGLFHAEIRGIAGIMLRHYMVQVEEFSDPSHEGIDTRVSMKDLRVTLPDGTVPVTGFLADTRSVGWTPQCLLVALMAATPMGWRQIAISLFKGVLLLNLSLALVWTGFIAYAVNANGTGWKKEILYHVYDITVQNLWFSFLLPVVIWWSLCSRVVWDPTGVGKNGQ